MVELIARLKNWQIITLGIITWILAIGALTVLASLCYDAFPEAYGVVAAGHFLAAIGVAWFIPNPFIKAWYLRKAHQEILELLALLNSYYEAAEPVES